MTIEDVERYKGRRIRLNDMCSNPNNRGRTGILVGTRFYDSAVEFNPDDGGGRFINSADKIDLIEEIDRSPLPLPG